MPPPLLGSDACNAARTNLQQLPAEVLGKIFDLTVDDHTSSFDRRDATQSLLSVCQHLRLAHCLSQASREYAVRTPAQAGMLLERLRNNVDMSCRATRLCLGFMPEADAAVLVAQLISAFRGGLTWFGWELGDEPCYDLIDSTAANAIASIGTNLRVFRFWSGHYEDMQLKHLGL